MAHAKDVMLQSVQAHGRADLPPAFAAMVREHAEATITFSDSVTYVFPSQFAELAIRSRLPLMSPYREVAQAGGLMSYGSDLPDMFRRAAGYVDKILKCAKPADLPVEKPTKFEFSSSSKPPRPWASPSPPHAARPR